MCSVTWDSCELLRYYIAHLANFPMDSSVTFKIAVLIHLRLLHMMEGHFIKLLIAGSILIFFGQILHAH